MLDLRRGCPTRLLLLLGCCHGSGLHPAAAQNYEWHTFAGNSGGSGLNDGPSSTAHFSGPAGLVADLEGACYVTDANNHSIRKISTNGEVSTFAGLPNAEGSADGSGSAARFKSPSGIAIDLAGNLYVSDAVDHTIRKITPAGEVSTLAGLPGLSGFTDGPSGSARFNTPRGVAVDLEGNIIVADSGNNTIRKVTQAGVVSTLAGAPGGFGTADGVASAARFRTPRGLAMAYDGTLYIADSAGHTIRKLSTSGVVSTIAGAPAVYGNADGTGTQARFKYPTALCFASDGNLWVADQLNGLMKKVTLEGVVSSISTGQTVLGAPSAVITAANGDMIVAESTRHLITRISTSSGVSYLAGTPQVSGSSDGSAATARFTSPEGVAATADGQVVIADTGNHTIRRMTPEHAVITVAGAAGISGNSDGVAGAARFNSPRGLALSPDGTIHVSDSANDMVRRVSAGGEVSTLAGQPGSLPPAQQFLYPDGLALAADGNLFVADSNQIRRISPSGTITHLAGTQRIPTTVGNTTILFWSLSIGTGNGDGSGYGAVIHHAAGPCFGPGGDLYFADADLHTIRKLSPSGRVTTLAGGAKTSGAADGIGPAARFSGPRGVVFDANGILFTVDRNNHTIRRMAADGTVTTIGGIPGYAGIGDGVGAGAQFSSPSSIAIDGEGNLFIADSGNHRIVRGVPLDWPEIEVVADNSILLDQGEGNFGFGELPVQSSISKTFTIRNSGRSPLGITGVHLEGDRFDLALPPSFPAEIPAGGSAQFTVSFAPTDLGPHSATLEIESTDHEEGSFRINLEGTGLSRAPVFRGYTITTPYEAVVTLPLADLLGRCYDPDGDPIELTAAGPLATEGGSVTISPPHLIFTPKRGHVGPDYIPITITDSHGQSASGYMKVVVGSIPLPAIPPKLTMLANGDVSLSYHGKPGTTYQFERSLDLDEWTILSQAMSDPTSGLIEFVDEDASHPSAYYRVNTPSLSIGP